MTVSRSSGVTVSRSRVYFGFCSSNLLTCISIAVLSRLVVSGVSVRFLITSPPPWPPPQPVVPRSTAPASPAPLSLRKSLRLTALVALGICSSFHLKYLQVNIESPRLPADADRALRPASIQLPSRRIGVASGNL